MNQTNEVPALDLEAIEKRYQRTTRRILSDVTNSSLADIPALIAEVRRLEAALEHARKLRDKERKAVDGIMVELKRLREWQAIFAEDVLI